MNCKLDCMRYAGRINQEAIERGFEIAQPGITLAAINDAVEQYILDNGCQSAFKDYQPTGAKTPFPATCCISPNDVVVHGIPNDYVLEPGDLLTIDVGCEYRGWYVDSARSRVIPCPFAAPQIYHDNARKAQYLIEATDAVLNAQLEIIRDGCSFLELVNISEITAHKYGINIMAQWGGHQIGNRVHIDPFIPSAIDRRQSSLKQKLDSNKYARQKLAEGQTICIEPVTTYGTSDIILDGDLWTVRQRDGLLAAHTERCLLVTKESYELLS